MARFSIALSILAGLRSVKHIQERHANRIIVMDATLSFTTKDNVSNAVGLVWITILLTLFLDKKPPNNGCKETDIVCIKNACDGATCAAYPQATCKTTDCNGCIAEWYYRGQRVECGTPCLAHNSVNSLCRQKAAERWMRGKRHCLHPKRMHWCNLCSVSTSDVQNCWLQWMYRWMVLPRTTCRLQYVWSWIACFDEFLDEKPAPPPPKDGFPHSFGCRKEVKCGLKKVFDLKFREIRVRFMTVENSNLSMGTIVAKIFSAALVFLSNVKDSSSKEALAKRSAIFAEVKQRFCLEKLNNLIPFRF